MTAALAAILLALAAGGEHVAVAPVPPAEMTVSLGGTAGKQVVAGANGEPALRVDVPERGEHPWSVVLHSPPNAKPVREGDLLVTSVRARAVGDRAETGLVAVFAEGVDYTRGSVGGSVQPTRAVRTFRRSLVAPGNFAPGEFRVALHLAPQPQTVEIYAVGLEVYPPGTPPATMNLDGVTWPGREPDAPWRVAANARIDEFRKAPLTVRVTDPAGDPVAGAEVTVRQKRHAWRFGTFVGDTLLANSEDGRRYREAVLRRHNFLTLPAYLADWGWRDPAARRRYLELADWAQVNGLGARGHLLVYPGWAVTPPGWFPLPKPELRAKLEAHIPAAARTFRRRGVTEWDVTNELRYNRDFMEELGGMGVAADWFKRAREVLPDGVLYVNETQILPNGGNNEAEIETYLKDIRTLLDAGAPVGGIGLQGHFRSEFTGGPQLLAVLDRFAAFGLPITITEFDMDNDDKRAQADYLRDFYTALFSHPNAAGIVMWQFWESDMWQPRGHHFTKDWRPTPLSKAYDDLVLGEWWTDEADETDAAGGAAFRPFKGVQTVTVRHAGYDWTRDVEVGDDGAAVEVVVP